MSDHYATLGVGRNATPEEIKRAYRKMASAHHPDKGGDKTTFQNIQVAYDTLSDPQKRAQYDNPAPQFNFSHQGFPGGFDFDNIFNMFGARFQHPGHQPRQQVMRMTLWITLEDVARGGRRTVSVGTQTGTYPVEIDIPIGVSDGDAFQYQGLAPGGGDLVINYRVHPNPKWQRQGFTLITEQTVSIWDLILGGETEIRDVLNQPISITVPPRTQPGSILRLKGRGIQGSGAPAGDILVKVQATIPEYINPDIIDVIREKGNVK